MGVKPTSTLRVSFISALYVPTANFFASSTVTRWSISPSFSCTTSSIFRVFSFSAFGSISINSSNNVSPQIGNYTYPELIEILKNKTFPQNKNSTNVDDLRWKYWTALDIFKDYYRRFCNGIDDAYNQVCDTTFISEHFDTFEEDYHLCQYVCPYFMSFNLIDYSSQEQKYLISKDGKFFYTQLEVNGELSE